MNDPTDTTRFENGGRDANGRFAPGNPGGPGAPPGGRQDYFRRRLLGAIRDEDVDTAISTFRELMQPGQPPKVRLEAAKSLLDRAAGRPADPSLEGLIAEAESLLAGREQR